MGLFFILFLTQPCYPQPQSAAEDISARREICLQTFIESENVSRFTQLTAQLLQDKNPREVNDYFTLIEPEQLNFARCAVLLRLLILPPTGELLTPSTRMTLGETVSEYIKTSLPILLFQSDESFEPESLKLAKPMILLAWFRYIEQSDSAYEWFSPERIRQQQETQTQRIQALLDTWLRTGFTFRGSHEYVPLLTSLINLHDLSEDETLKTKTIALAEIILTEIALENLDGLWGGIRQNTYSQLSPVTVQWLSFLLFGGPKPDTHDEIDPGLFILCHTRYRLPPLLERLGRERFYRGTYELKHRYRTHTESLNRKEEVRKYSYVTPHFILSSFQLEQQTVPWQSRPWDLLIWNEPRHNTHIISFNGSQLFSGKDPLEQTEYSIWNATTRQHKNVLFSHYHPSARLMLLEESAKEHLIPNYEQLPTRVWIPNSLTPVEEAEGWQFIQSGKVYVALRPIPGKSYWWRTAETDQEGSERAAILGFRDLYAGMIVEVETESARLSSFNQFKQQVIEAPLVIRQDSVTFVSRRGDVYHFPTNGDGFLVNGKRIHPHSDPEYEWFSSPFVNSKWDSGFIEARWNPFSLVIDMRNPDNPIRRF